ncbi:MAG: recombinase family protein [Chloroflexi bacterium]|nr:recombinase family protein [Chloroflexota bacterium]
MRSIGYCTYDPSASPESTGTSRSRLESDFADYCRRKDHNLVAVFADSQEEPTRPAFRDMLQHIREATSSFLVLVHKPEHLGITLEQAVEGFLAIDQLGSQVLCTDENLPDPLQGLLKAFHNGANSVRRQRIREGMEAKALLGEGLGRPPYGYRIGATRRLEEVSQEAEVVHLMFRLYREQGLGLRSIVGYLNQHGYLTRRGRSWSMGTIRDILRNRVYIGTYTRFGLRLPGSHPPMISPQEFRQVQDMMQARSPIRRSPVQEPFLLSGLVYCEQCGNRMIGVTRRQSWHRKDGRRMRSVYRYYQCQSRTNQGLCEYQTWRAEELEKAVVTELYHRLDMTTPAAANRKGGTPMVAGQPLQGEMASWPENLRRRYLRYLRSAARGATTLGRLRRQLSRLAQEQQALSEGELLSPEMASQPAVWQNADQATRRKLLGMLLERVETTKSRVVLRLKVQAFERAES